MQHHLRRITALVAAAALTTGALVATAGAANAVISAPPTAVEAFGINSGYGLTWSPPATGTPVSYTARLYDGADTTYSTVLQTKVVAATADDAEDGVFADFRNLTIGHEYIGTVTSTIAGPVESAPVAGDKKMALQQLGAPTSLKVTPGNHSLALSWKAPVTSALTGPIQGYLVFTESDSAPFTFPEFPSASATKVTVSGLKNGTNYLVSIFALTDDLGLTAEKHATPIGKPAKPKSLKVAWRSGGKTKLTWKAPKSTRANPVTGYYVYVNGKKVKTLAGKKATNYTVKGQKHGKKYTYKIRARNAASKSKALTKTLTRP